MAKKFALVPASWLDQRPDASPMTNESDNIKIYDVGVKSNKFSELAELLPKNLRNKARLMLHYLEGKISINDQERIVYGDDYVGSYLLDLVRYYVSPLVKTRPIDAPRFEKLLSEVGVPSSAYSRPFENSHGQDGALANWKQY